MKTFFRVACFLAGCGLLANDPPKTRELSIALSESREVLLAVPEGFAFETANTASGPVVKITHAKENVSLDLEFRPDTEREYAGARARSELMNELFADYVESSTEKAMQFEELEPRVGAGTFCTFTDAKLVGVTTLPPNEFRHLTVGVKAWPGAVAVFRCFSNDTKSSSFQSVLRMLRESVHEKPVPLK